MGSFQKHLRNTFLTGIFAAAPIAVTAFVIVYVENATRAPLQRWFNVRTPFAGVLVALALIYLLGLLVNSLLGRWMISVIDRVLLRVPVLKELYQAWKHVSVTPGGKEGIFAKVVLVPVETGRARTLGFTSGVPIPVGVSGATDGSAAVGDRDGAAVDGSGADRIAGAPGATGGGAATCCVFVPAAPNPMNGRLYFVPLAEVTVLDLSPEEAFKIILSSGNYVPPEVGRAIAMADTEPRILPR